MTDRHPPERPAAAREEWDTAWDTPPSLPSQRLMFAVICVAVGLAVFLAARMF